MVSDGVRSGSMRAARLLPAAVALVLVAACGGSSASRSAGTTAPAATAAPTAAAVESTDAGADTSSTTVSQDTTSAEEPTPTTAAAQEPTTATTDESATTLPSGAQPGLDDYDGDGEPDPTCGTQDFGAGLVLRIPCTISTANEPAQGTTLVDGSLFRLPGSTDVDLTGISGSLLLARDAAGTKVVIVVFNSDGLFGSGSDVINSTDTLDGTIRLVNSLYPGSVIQVRGHTDARGTASANQALSERRAARVKDYLTSHGVKAASVTSVGLGSTSPLTKETNPDGSVNPEGQHFNRRVEIVLRVP